MLLAQLLWPPSFPSASKSPHHPDTHFANTCTVHTTIRALTSLNISKNGLLTKEAGKVLGDMLKANSVLKELDVSGSGEDMWSSEKDGPGFAKELAAGVSTNGALTSLNLAGNSLEAEGAKHIAEAIKSNVSALRLVPV